MRVWLLRIFTIALCSIITTVLYAQPAPAPDAVELKLALKKLTMLGSVLYVAAHPDDENTALLTYLTKGRLIRAAYLSTTRGEGGQNLIGSEQGDLLGVIRTQELLAARRIDGAEQFFTRAIDFGYSKTSEEALRVWNKREILSDMVWVIRKFQPDVIITRFSPTTGGHGHHTASAILAQEAFAAAGDPLQFPEQLTNISPWKPKRILFNVSRFLSTTFDTVSALKVDVGGYSPLLGRSYTEISGMSRSMHKSQGFGATQNRGTNINYFLHTAGDSAKVDFFDGVNITWSRIPGGARIGKILQEAYDSFIPENPSAVISLLMKAHREMEKLSKDPRVEIKRRDLVELIRVCAGIWLDANASYYSATPGSKISITWSAINRSHIPISIESVGISDPRYDTTMHEPLLYNTPINKTLSVSLPQHTSYTQPYWLQEHSGAGHYTVAEPNLILQPENRPAVSVVFYLKIDASRIAISVPLQYRWVDPVEGEVYRPFEIVPNVAVNLEENVHLFSFENEKTVSVKLKSNQENAEGRVRLKLPEGWNAKPAAIPFTLKSKNDENTVTFTVSPSKTAADGLFIAEAEMGNTIISQGITTIKHSHIPSQTMFPPAEGKLVKVNFNRPRKQIGYIMGSGDGIPAALKQIGYTVTLLSDDELEKQDLSMFDAIVSGVRAYNTRPTLRVYQQRLMDYVKNGGTYIVQYVTLQSKESENLGPYPFSVSRDRVSVEDATITFVNPNNPLLNRPNKITQQDFEGWVQERGLYFADKWDSVYQPVLSSNDPGETAKAGGLLITKHGKGVFIYTGYSFFRQLPAGVPGAYRLFVNIIEAKTAN